MQRKLNGEFIKGYSEQFSEKVTSIYFAEKKSISGKEILSVTPSKQVNFFVLKILFSKWQDEMKKLKSPYFSYDSNEVKRAMVDFMNTLSQNIAIDGDHFISLLEQAVAETIILMIAPDQFLRKELEGKDVRQINEKLTKPLFKYIKLYKSDLESFFNAHSDEEIESFLEASEKHFSEFYKDEVIESELINLSQVLPVELDDLLEQEDRDEAPKPVERDSFFDRDIAIEDAVEEETEDQSEMVEPMLDEIKDDSESEEETDFESENEAVNDEIEVSDPEKSSEDLENEDTVLSEEKSEGQGNEVESESVEEEVSSEVNAEDSTDDTEIKEEQEVLSEDKMDEEDESEAINQKYTKEKSTINDQFSSGEDEQVTVAERLDNKKVNKIMEGISVNHRYMFTKELFDGDRDAFVSAIDKIEARESFDDAVELLVQKFAKERDWDMSSEEVKELLKIVFRKFR